MALVLKQNPTDVDKLIDKWQRLLYKGLVTNGTWTKYQSYHRAYKNDDNEDVRPERFVSDNEYKGVFTNDGFCATSFFLVSDISPLSNGMTEATISVIFQMNLADLYPQSPHRFDAEAINDINSINRRLDGRFTSGELARTIDDVYTGFDTEAIKKKSDMQPNNVVRFDMDVVYQTNCGDVYAVSGITCDVGVSVSTTPPTLLGGNDGTATANVSGDQGALSFLWNDPSAQTTQVAVNLIAGNYQVTVTDAIKDDCNASASGTVEAGAPPVFAFGNCLEYDGANDRVVITNIPIGSSDDYGVNLWANTEDLTNRVFYSGSGVIDHVTLISSTQIRLTMNGTEELFTVAAVSLNTWFMLTVSRIAGILRVYINGVESTTGGVSSTATTKINALGGFAAQPSFGWKGLLDEIGLIVGTGITTPQSVSLYATGNGQDFDTVIGSSTAYWHYNETGTATTAVDENGNFNGSLTNFVPEPWTPHI